MTARLLLAFQRVDPRVLLHEQFDKDAWDPATWKGMIIAVSAILGLLVILHFVFYYEKRAKQPHLPNCPHKLFAEVLHHVGLTTAQRELLLKMARDLKLPAPTTMLLTPGALAQASDCWLKNRPRTAPQELQHLRTIAVVLFGAMLPAGDSGDG